MQPAAAILPLGAADGGPLEVIVWLVVGAFWLVGQIAGARRKKQRLEQLKAERDSDPSDPYSSGAGQSPAPDELAEIFKRLGASVPATPPPVPRTDARAVEPPPHPVHESPKKIHAAYRVHNPTPYQNRPEVPRPKDRVQPELARRLARAKKEAQEAAREADAAARLLPEFVQGIDSRSDDNQSIDTATRTSGLILPRLYAMGMPLVPMPSIPMPGLDHTQFSSISPRVALHTRAQLRNAVLAQVFLQPAKEGYFP
jgi:type IV secretory pathway VirB10-like protein